MTSTTNDIFFDTTRKTASAGDGTRFSDDKGTLGQHSLDLIYSRHRARTGIPQEQDSTAAAR